jgi:hypothetical protein
MPFPLSCYRVIRVGVRAPFDWSRLVVQRHAPKDTCGVIRLVPNPFNGVLGLYASLRGYRHESLLGVSDMS